jgi:MYXO-CTERM domain-containing protein
MDFFRESTLSFHSVLFDGSAHGPFGVFALLIIVALILYRRRRGPP